MFRTNFNNDDDYEQYKEIYKNSYTLFQQKLLSGGYKVYTSINMDVQQMLQDAVDDNLKGYTAEKDGGMKCRQQLLVLIIQQEM
ncbi:MAG: hypothetical protein ACLRMX_06985 [Lachnospira eligens]